MIPASFSKAAVAAKYDSNTVAASVDPAYVVGRRVADSWQGKASG